VNAAAIEGPARGRMSAATLCRLAVAGNRTDALRTGLTALSSALAALALLAAATVISITGLDGEDASGMAGWAQQYTNPLLREPGLRPGVMIALVLLSFPVLALAGQCIRLGAPARDRRLAAIRLAGATPRESVLIATAETAVAGLLGSVLGLTAYLIGRKLIARGDHRGSLRLPTDVLPHPVVIGAILLLVPLLAALIGAVLMRRVIVTPLGVVRLTRAHGPKPWPGLLIAAGLVLFAVPLRWDNDGAIPGTLFYVLLGGGVLLTIAGVVLGTGWISHTAGRLLRRFGRGPATLLAGQRLIVDPWNGSRTLAALLAAVITGAGALGYRAHIDTLNRVYQLFNQAKGNIDGNGVGLGDDPEFYFGAIRLVMITVSIGVAVAVAGVLVALAESIVARRRTFAALTAGGVPRRTLATAVLWQTLTPLVPALLIGLAAGDALVRLLGTRISYGGPGEQCASINAAGECVREYVNEPFVELAVPVPWVDLAVLGGGALLAMLVAVGAGLLVLRSSTDLEELRV
jgi:FtsX-like permease family protein